MTTWRKYITTVGVLVLSTLWLDCFFVVLRPKPIEYPSWFTQEVDRQRERGIATPTIVTGVGGLDFLDTSVSGNFAARRRRRDFDLVLLLAPFVVAITAGLWFWAGRPRARRLISEPQQVRASP